MKQHKNRVKTVSKFNVTVTKMTANDTIETFEKKVYASALTGETVAKLIHELDCKEGAWGIERCSDVREYLEGYEA
jgi:hypothetical protein